MDNLKKAILKKRNPELYFLEQLDEMQEKLQTLVAEVEGQKEKVSLALKDVEQKSKNIDKREIVKLVTSNFRQPKDGKDVDEEKVISSIMSQIRQPKDGETPVIDEERIARKAASLIPAPKDGKTPVAGVDFKVSSQIEVSEIADKLNSKEEIIERKVIKGLETYLRNLERSIREKGGTSGGGMGNVIHQNTATTSATTTVSTTYKIAADGNALWLYYNGQLLMKDTHYTVGGDHKTITFLISLENSTNISIVYIRT